MDRKTVLSAIMMQAVDRATIEQIGISQDVLMERAALAVVNCAVKYDPKRILCVCGTGNNGGDAIAVARILLMQGFDAHVFLCGDESKYKDAVRKQLDIFIKVGGKTRTDMDFAEYDMIVDGIFGVGLSRNAEGIYRDVIEAVNLAKPRGTVVISVDLPSGIHTDTGAVMGIAVRADETVSFAYYKPGHLLYPGAEYCGNIQVADIGINPDTVKDVLQNHELSATETGIFAEPDLFTMNRNASIAMPHRARNGNKGTFGRVLVIAGSSSMYGACYLSALSALRCGAGLVDIYSHEVNRSAVQNMLPEAVFHSYDEDVTKLIRNADCVVIGPGLSTDDMAVSLVRTVLLSCDKTIVADADALNCIAYNSDLAELLKAHQQSDVILTPHPGELARLTGFSVPELKEDYITSVRNLACKYGCIVIGKDAGTVVSDGKRVYLNQTGNSGMATAGSGDVLSGIVGALCAQKELAFDAAWKGVFLHGKAGDTALKHSNAYSLLAGDIAHALKEIITE